MRWPSIHWALAQAYVTGTDADRTAIAATFAGLNSFLGNYVGEFLGELSFSMFFLLSGLAMLARGSRISTLDRLPRRVHGGGRMIGMFRNVTDVVDPIAAVNNYLLPLWMIIFGVALIRHRHASPDDFSAADSLTA